MPSVFTRRDTLLQRTRSLPGAASTTVNSTPLELPTQQNANFLVDCQFELIAPALSTTIAPDTRTMTYQLIGGHKLDSNGAIDSPVVLQTLATQTGAGGAGAAKQTIKGQFGVDVPRYVALRIVSGASTTDASALSAEFSILL